MNTNILMKVVEFLKSQGVEVKVNEETRNAVIGLCITTLVKNGMAIEAATDFILGAGTFKKIADDVWETNNA